MIYDKDDGTLCRHIIRADADTVRTDLESGRYSVYALSDIGKFIPPQKEDEIISISLGPDIPTKETDPVPMSWKGEIQVSSGHLHETEINMEPLVSAIVINIGENRLPGLAVTSLRICQEASVIRPFLEEGSKAVRTDETWQSRELGSQALDILNSGGSVTAYVLENCQGDLLKGNDDPWKKVPENLGETSGLCTYVEMTCAWDESSAYEGQITYRFFLGEDATCNFDIRRNTCQRITTRMHETSFSIDSWKIDTSQMCSRFAEISFFIDEDNRILASCTRDLDTHIKISGSLSGHIRCVTVQDPFFTIWGHYFTHEVTFHINEKVHLCRKPVQIGGNILEQSLQEMRDIRLYSVLDARKIEDFMYPRNTEGTIREYMKPYEMSMKIGVSSARDITGTSFDGRLKYDYKVSDPVSWYTSLFHLVTMVPSSYSRFDSRLDDDGCPPGETFKAEVVSIEPETTFDVTPLP